MKAFVDSSVLVAAFWRGHPGHEPSLDLVSRAEKTRTACGVHSLAEVYATMTALPVKEMIQPEQALLFLDEIRNRCSIVTLTANEYAESIEACAARGFTSGRVCDALLLKCARKVAAKTIYTWNLKHFRAIDPELADRIRTP